MHKGMMVKEAREAQGLTQSELGARAKVAQSAISAIETGRYGMGVTWAHQIGCALNIPPADLITWPDDAEPGAGAKEKETDDANTT